MINLEDVNQLKYNLVMHDEGSTTIQICVQDFWISIDFCAENTELYCFTERIREFLLDFSGFLKKACEISTTLQTPRCMIA